MPLVTVANLQHSYGSHVVLDGATMSIEPGEKIGLVGRNGCGKTTLMRCLLGDMTPDAGTVQLQRGARVGYLSQDPTFDPEDTVRIAAMGAFETLHDLHHQLDVVFHKMAEADGEELERLLRRQADLEARIEAEGGYAIDHKIDATLHGLGFTDDQFDLSVTVLSGGQLNRLGLARLLLQAPDLLLLDEPTNHLDIDGRRWLENFLVEEYPGAVLLVSHDRWLLDKVVTRIVEVDRGTTHDYPGNYHRYVELRRERQLTRARVHDKQLDKIRQEEQFIRRYKTGQRAKQARGRQSRLDRFKRDELVERPTELSVMNLKLPEAPRSGEQVIIADGISKTYDELTLFDTVDLRIGRGDRIGIIGPNGTGKTTLIRCLLGELEPDTGSVRLGSRVSVGIYRQLHDHLDLSLTVWQYLQSVIVSLDGGTIASEQQARDLAGAFLFSGIEQDKALHDLSGGERSRAVLAGLVAGAHNLLVLDEPTNHLDVPSAERLEQALSLEGSYRGALLLVSHDRALLQATCDKLLIFDGKGGVRLFQGRYTDWLEYQRQEQRGATDRVASRAAKPRKANTGKANAGQPNGQKNPLSNLSIEKIEQRIEELESKIAAADESLLDPEVYTDGDRVRDVQAQRSELVAQLEPLEEEWARRAEA